jgi:hypothetical protein
MISGWQESYLGYSNYLSDGCGLGDTPAPDPGGAVGYEHGWPNHGPLRSFRLAVVHQKTPVMGDSTQEALGVSMP